MTATQGAFSLALVEVTVGSDRALGWEVECSLCGHTGALLSRPEVDTFIREHRCG